MVLAAAILFRDPQQYSTLAGSIFDWAGSIFVQSRDQCFSAHPSTSSHLPVHARGVLYYSACIHAKVRRGDSTAKARSVENIFAMSPYRLLRKSF